MEKDFIIVPRQNNGANRDIFLTPGDIREVQLAKSAIYAGIVTLMRVANVDFEHIERVYLAGGFGNYVRVESGIRIGLLPEALRNRIIPIGNSAGSDSDFVETDNLNE